MTTFLFSLPPRSTFVGRSAPYQGRNGPGRRWAPMALLLALSSATLPPMPSKPLLQQKKRRLQRQVKPKLVNSWRGRANHRRWLPASVATARRARA